MSSPSPRHGSPEQLDSFEAELLAALTVRVQERATLTSPASTGVLVQPNRIRSSGRTVSRRIGQRSAWPIGLITSAVVAIVAALPLAASTPAYAISTTPRGDVTVTVMRLDDSAGLENALRDNGIHAVVDVEPQGKVCRFDGRFVPATSDGRPPLGTTIDGGKLTFTIPHGWVAADETLVLTLSTSPPAQAGERAGAFAIGIAVARGPVGPCVLEEMPTIVIEGRG